MRLDVIPVAAAVLLLDHVPGLDQVRDDTEGAPLGDVQAVRDIAQTHSGVVGDQQQNPSMGGQEGPARHISMLTVSGKSLLVLRLPGKLRVVLAGQPRAAEVIPQVRGGARASAGRSAPTRSGSCLSRVPNGLAFTSLSRRRGAGLGESSTRS